MGDDIYIFTLHVTFIIISIDICTSEYLNNYYVFVMLSWSSKTKLFTFFELHKLYVFVLCKILETHAQNN